MILKFVQLITSEIIFFKKSGKLSRGTSFRPFLFKNIHMNLKQVVSILVSIWYVSPRLGLTMKINFVKFVIVDPEICSGLNF